MISRQTLDRLMQYYHYLSENFDPQTEVAVSSAQLARQLSLDDSQIRKDLAAIGIKGHCHVGFKIEQVLNSIRQRLGLDQLHPAVLIGAGRLGGAIGSYKGFAHYGLQVVALFDVDPGKIGLLVGEQLVQPLDQLERIVAQAQVRLGILTVPAEAAQESADRLVQAGVKVIWNFSPGHLHVPPEVFVRHERLFVALAELFYNIKRREERKE